MSLWRSIVSGVGSQVGAELVKKGLDELDDDPARREEAKARALAARNRKLAVGAIVVSALGLLVLSGALTAIIKWVLGALFIAGLAGGSWYLLRKRWRAFRAERVEKQAREDEVKTERDKARSIEAQLAEMKKKRAQRSE